MGRCPTAHLLSTAGLAWPSTVPTATCGEAPAISLVTSAPRTEIASLAIHGINAEEPISPDGSADFQTTRITDPGWPYDRIGAVAGRSRRGPDRGGLVDVNHRPAAATGTPTRSGRPERLPCDVGTVPPHRRSRPSGPAPSSRGGDQVDGSGSGTGDVVPPTGSARRGSRDDQAASVQVIGCDAERP